MGSIWLTFLAGVWVGIFVQIGCFAQDGDGGQAEKVVQQSVLPTGSSSSSSADEGEAAAGVLIYDNNFTLYRQSSGVFSLISTHPEENSSRLCYEWGPENYFAGGGAWMEGISEERALAYLERLQAAFIRWGLRRGWLESNYNEAICFFIQWDRLAGRMPNSAWRARPYPLGEIDEGFLSNYFQLREMIFAWEGEIKRVLENAIAHGSGFVFEDMSSWRGQHVAIESMILQITSNRSRSEGIMDEPADFYEALEFFWRRFSAGIRRGEEAYINGEDMIVPLILAREWMMDLAELFRGVPEGYIAPMNAERVREELIRALADLPRSLAMQSCRVDAVIGFRSLVRM